MVGGAPCQGPTRVNVAAAGWHDQRTQLVRHIPRAARTIRKVAPQVVVRQLVEKVASMSEEDRACFTELLGHVPTEICASGCSPARRPRWYWFDWPLLESADLTWQVSPGLVTAELRGPWPTWADRLEEGAYRPRGELASWATFMRPIPREKPPQSPAGLQSCSAEVKSRWKADAYRYAPYQYRVQNIARRGCDP